MTINFKKAVENALIGFYVSTLKGNFLYANDYFIKLFGYKDFDSFKKLYIPRDIYAYPEDREKFIDKLKESGTVQSIQIKVKNRWGELLDIILSGTLVDNERIEGWIIDITEHQYLKKQLELNNRIIEENSDAIFITDRTGLIIYTNKKFKTLMGDISENTYAKDFIPVSSKHLQKFKEINKQLFKKGVWIGELEILGRNNKIIHCGVKIFTLLNNKGEIENYISFYRDISEKKELEAQLKHSQKMEILGELSSSLIHDMNNIFMSLNYNCELIKMVKDTKPEKIEKYLLQINTTIENAQDILNKFSMLSKKTQISKSPISVSILLKDLLLIVSPMIKKRSIKITLQDRAKNIRIMGNKSSFVQTILNLVINAADAIQEKNSKNGLIEIISEKIEINNKFFIRLIIRDNGIGMDTELLNKIYEPFFTTKGNKGTGLGLSIVFKEINELNGTITVFSEKDIGTEFVITIPALNISEKDDAEEKEEDMAIRNKKIIYLMDDDNLFRSSISDYLEYYGYEVYDFEKSEDLFKQLSIKIPDIMLLDFILEDSLTGEDILKYLSKHNLKFPVIILSGYIDLSITDLRKYENVKAIVQKPISGEELLKKLKTFYEIN